MNYDILIKKIVASNPQSFNDVMNTLRQKAGEFKVAVPDKSLVLKAYRQMVDGGQISPHAPLERMLRRREIRTLSGVAPVTVMTAPLSCPSDCVYCPTEAKMPKSYLSNQPAAMRAVLSKFDPYKQTITRLDTLYNNGHFPEKIEIIVNGGTWSAHPIRYKTWFIKRIFDACNEFKPYSYEREDLITTGERKTLIARRLSEYNHDWFQENKLGGVEDNELMGLLEKAQAINEKSRWRIIGLTLETRPD
ncbi:hypothetical protein HY224_02600, partial [Candidatus Uhrbacteria bacterium]|nr:hypothetical protein [Candidatus Uhrbacteria bacterium]